MNRKDKPASRGAEPPCGNDITEGQPWWGRGERKSPHSWSMGWTSLTIETHTHADQTHPNPRDQIFSENCCPFSEQTDTSVGRSDALGAEAESLAQVSPSVLASGPAMRWQMCHHRETRLWFPQRSTD